MKHIDDSELMEYAAGRLPTPRNQDVLDHLAVCPECSERQREAALLWDALGHWTVDTAGHEVAGRITALAQEHRNTGASRRAVTPTIYALVLRVAASIIIAVAIGHRLGRSSVTGNMETAAASKDRPEYL
ncbi:MAG: zf-HC2 domain-containing protein, partial [Planctomycetota bacterium]